VPFRLFDVGPFDILSRVLCLVYVALHRYVYLFAPSLRWVPWPPPFGSPAVPHLHRYHGLVRLLADPSPRPPVSLGRRYSASRVCSLPVGHPRFPRTWFFRVGRNRTQSRERSEALLGSREVLLKACPGLGTPATPAQPRVCGCLDAAFRQANGVGVAMTNDVGAESSQPASLLCTLRPAGRPTRRNTRYRSARYGFDRAGLAPAGLL
jgi:hypothetical protein